MALNGGPMYTINEAISLFVSCDDQAEIDRLWDALAEGGKPLRCGWITDRFGVTWQIIPKSLGNFLGGPDREAASRARAAMMTMVKLDIAGLQAAYDGR
jgi:predicted 3-demethylubiquinone-9 3-methyltransferase (glyoxalase superfamily)